MRKFYIVNEIDAPTERLIAEECNGKLYYVHPDFRDDAHFGGMSMESATRVEDFGVDLCLERGYPQGTSLSGFKIRPSEVKYKDGRVRHWQGSAIFRFELKDFPETGDKVADLEAARPPESSLADITVLKLDIALRRKRKAHQNTMRLFNDLQDENAKLRALLERDEKPIWMEGALNEAEVGLELAIKCLEHLKEGFVKKRPEEGGK